MFWGRRLVGAGALVWGLLGLVASAEAAPPAATMLKVDFFGQPSSMDARRTAEWAFTTGDTKGRPFAVVDKKNAHIYVFDGAGRLVGSAASLLGLAKGDGSAPGVAQKVSTGIPLAERTTPAGRFDSEPGHNIHGEAIVWVDYGAAVAIHRLRPAPASQRRPERLVSANPDDRRISLGCIVVSPAFYDEVIAPTLGSQRGVVYVLPEDGGTQAVASAAQPS